MNIFIRRWDDRKKIISGRFKTLNDFFDHCRKNDISLAYADFRYQNFNNNNLKYLDLHNIIFYKAKFNHSDFNRANFYKADFSHAKFNHSDFNHVNFSHANFYHANFNHSDFNHVNFSHANFNYADFYHSDFNHANFNYAYFSHANFYKADFNHSDFNYAYFSKTIKKYLKLNKIIKYQIPQNQDLIVWAKKNNTLVKLLVPKKSKRTGNIINRKCRCQYVKTLWIQDSKKSITVKNKFGITKYELNKITKSINGYDDNPVVDCAQGIHFFLTKEEAKDW